MEESATDGNRLVIVDESPGRIVTEKRSAVFEISKDNYDAIQLTAAAALTRDGTGALPADLPILLLDAEYLMQGTVGYFDCLIKLLAQDIGADLISVDPVDLEALGRSFLLQDRAIECSSTSEPLSVGKATVDTKEGESPQYEQPDQTSAHGLAYFYFGGRNDETTQTRRESAMDALVSLVSIKRAKVSGNKTGENKSPLLVFINDLKVLEPTRLGISMMTAFTACMEKLRRRTKGCPDILGIVSGDQTGAFKSHYVTTFRISRPSNYSHQIYTAIELAYRKSQPARIRDYNTCRFRSILQAKLIGPGLDHFDDGSEKARQQWLSKVFCGEEACSEEDMTRAATQVLGKQRKNPELSFDDVAAITTRMRRNGAWDGEEESNEDDEETRKEEALASKSESEPDSNQDHEEVKQQPGQQRDIEEGDVWKDQTSKQLEKLRSECNDEEQEMLSSLVDPGKTCFSSSCIRSLTNYCIQKSFRRGMRM